MKLERFAFGELATFGRGKQVQQRVVLGPGGVAEKNKQP